MKKAILVIDLGGHSRVILVGLDGKILSVFSEDSQYTPDPAYIAGMNADTVQGSPGHPRREAGAGRGRRCGGCRP